MAEAWLHVGMAPVSCLLLSGRLLYAASRPEVARMANNSMLPPSIGSGGQLVRLVSSTPCSMGRVGRVMASWWRVRHHLMQGVKERKRRHFHK